MKNMTETYCKSKKTGVVYKFKVIRNKMTGNKIFLFMKGTPSQPMFIFNEITFELKFIVLRHPFYSDLF